MIKDTFYVSRRVQRARGIWGRDLTCIYGLPRQLFDGVNAVDKKHQIVVAVEVYGAGPEQQTLIPMLDSIQDCYLRLEIPVNLTDGELIITADTGFANEANMQHCHDNNINAYILDNQFRSRDPRFDDHLKPVNRKRQKKHKPIYDVSAFHFDPVTKTCRCPADNLLRLKKSGKDDQGNHKLFFEGRLTDCRSCPKKQHCMRNPHPPIIAKAMAGKFHLSKRVRLLSTNG